jgi:hypothetical protein
MTLLSIIFFVAAGYLTWRVFQCPPRWRRITRRRWYGNFEQRMIGAHMIATEPDRRTK